MGRKNKVKDMHTKRLIIDIRRQIKDSLTRLDMVAAKIPSYIKVGQDLFLTSNIWLIDDDTKVNPSKCLTALETLFIIRHYSETILTQWLTLRNLKTTFKEFLVKLKTGEMTPEEIMGNWVEKITAITSMGEIVSDAFMALKPIILDYEKSFKDNQLEGLWTILSAMLKEAEVYSESMKELNLNNLTKEEQTAADKIVEDALNGELSEEDAAKVMNGVGILNDALSAEENNETSVEATPESGNEEQLGEVDIEQIETVEAPDEKASEPATEESSDSHQ